MGISSYSTTPASNANVDGTSATNVAEGNLPSTVNNAVRQIMADLATAATVQFPLTGGQIAFPATQVPSSGANVLDDYEEGTFTPVFAFATPGDSTITATSALGSYEKIGRQVRIGVVLTFNTNAYTTASGNGIVSGLPFTPALALPLAMGYTDKVTIPANTQQLAPMVTTNSTILIWAVKDNATAATPLTTASFPASQTGISFYINGKYYV